MDSHHSNFIQSTLHYFILSLDGGGIRGLLHLLVLVVLEEILKKPTHEIFDCIIGTSTGGLITILLTVPDMKGRVKSAREALKIYYKESSVIFPKQFIGWGTTLLVLILSFGGSITGLVFLIITSGIFKWLSFPLIFTSICLSTSLDWLIKFSTSKYPRPINAWVKVIATLIVGAGGSVIFIYFLRSSGSSWWLLSLLEVPLLLSFVLGHCLWRFYSKPQYSNEGLLKVINDIYGDSDHFTITLADVPNCCKYKNTKPCCVGIVATDKRYRNSFIFNSIRARKGDGFHKIKISEIARATSAAPTYFRSAVINVSNLPVRYGESVPIDSFEPFERDPAHNFIVFEDGGTTNNNPSNLGLKLAKVDLQNQNVLPQNCKLHLLSLGTGIPEDRQEDPTKAYDEKSWSFFCNWSEEDGGIDDTLFSRVKNDAYEVELNSFKVCCKLQKKFQKPNSNFTYQRIQWKLESALYKNMDDVSPGNMEKLFNSVLKQTFLENDPNYKEIKAFIDLVAQFKNMQKNWSSPFSILQGVLSESFYNMGKELVKLNQEVPTMEFKQPFLKSNPDQKSSFIL